MMNFVSLWAIYPTTLTTHTHTNVRTPSPAHLSHLLKRSASEVHSVDTCIVSSCLRESSVYFSHYQTPLSTLSELSSSPFCHHSNVVFNRPFLHSLWFHTSPASVYYRAHYKDSRVQGSLPGKIRYENTQSKMLMVASIHKLNTGETLSKCYVSWQKSI